MSGSLGVFGSELEDGFIRDEVSAVNNAYDTDNVFPLWELMPSWEKNPGREAEVKKRVGEEVFLTVQNKWLQVALNQMSKSSEIVFPQDTVENNLAENERSMKKLSEKFNQNTARLKEIQVARSG